MDLLNAKETVALRVNKSFFETAGYTAELEMFHGKFDPTKQWTCKKRGELRVKFEGDEKSVSTTLKDLLAHGLNVVCLTQQFAFSDDEDDEDEPVAELGRRAAASVADRRLDELQATPGSDSSGGGSGDNYSPRPTTRSQDSSPWSSPLFGEQPAARSPAPVPRQPLPAREARTPPANNPGAAAAPRRSPRRANATSDDPYISHERDADSSDEEAEALESERMEYGKIFYKESADKNQPVNKLGWVLIDASQVKDDLRKRAEGVKGTEFPAQLLNLKDTPASDLDVYKTFKHFLPPTWLQRMSDHANEHLFDHPTDINYRKTTPAEIECVLGLCGAAAVNGSGPFSSFFSNAPFDDSGFFPCPGFGRFGVSKNRALIVMRNMHLSPGPQQPAGEGPHWFIQGPCDELTAHMAASFKASWLATMDESGPPWHGWEAEGHFDACPHVMYVPRKPEPVCAEFNTAACSLTRILNKIEYEMAAKYHAGVKYMDITGSYNAALAMRMAEPLEESNSLIYGDSRFGSVKSAFLILKHLGVHSAWDVKTATALFPKAELKRLTPKEHGAVVVMKAEISCSTPSGMPSGQKIVLFGVGQRRGKAVHTFLTTCGTFVKELPVRFGPAKYTKETAPWLTPSILNTITKAQPAIDVINRTVFEQLGLHDTFTTRSFEVRLVQHTLFPFLYVNAVNSVKYFNPKQYATDSPKHIMLELFSKMARNGEWCKESNTPADGPGGPAVAAGTRGGTSYAARAYLTASIRGGPPSRESPCKHVLIPLKDIPGYKGGKQQRCFECNELCSWACARCSDANNWIALHPTQTQGSKRKYGCLAAHRRNPSGSGYAGHHEAVSGTSKV